MENFDQIFTLLAEHEGISLNTDILETGLINILALLAILIYTGRDFLGSLLEERKTTIVNGVQDAEDRLNEAQKRLEEAKKQLNQANLVISEIKNETITTKKRLLESDAFQAKKDLTVRFERAFRRRSPWRDGTGELGQFGCHPRRHPHSVARSNERNDFSSGRRPCP